MLGWFHKLSVWSVRSVLSLIVLCPIPAWAGWEHTVRILTDISGASVYVNGVRVAALDNSMFATDEERYDERGRGGYGAYVDLGDFERHRVHVSTSVSPEPNAGIIMFAMPDTPTLTRFFPLKGETVVARRCALCDALLPSGTGSCPQCDQASEDSAVEGRVWNQFQEWATTGQGMITLILGSALFLCLVLILAVIRHRPGPTVVKPDQAGDSAGHMPTLIGQGWPYVMFEAYPEIRPLGKIGVGGVATVFLAHAPKYGNVAVKILHEHQSNDPALRVRFLEEVHVLGKLERTNVVPVAHAVSPKDFPRPWFAMTYLGQMYRLRDMIGGKEKKRLSLDWAYPVAAALCSSVDAIHRSGVIHRDLSPENVMYGFGSGMEVRLIDFDCAKMHKASLSRSALVHTGASNDMVGKIKYTAPEQWQCFDSATYASDVYAVGIIIWEMLVGSTPFNGNSMDDILSQHAVADRDIHALTGVGVPGQLAALLGSMLDPNPFRRPKLSVIRARIIEVGGVPHA